MHQVSLLINFPVNTSMSVMGLKNKSCKKRWGGELAAIDVSRPPQRLGYVSPKSAIDVNDGIWMSAAHQFALSHVFVHKGKKVTGCVSVLRVTGRWSTLWLYELAGFSPNAIFFWKAFFHTWVSGKWDAASRVIKKHGGDKVSVCSISIYSIFTSSILILSCIMRFAQNSSVCWQTEMSAPLSLAMKLPNARKHTHRTLTATH